MSHFLSRRELLNRRRPDVVHHPREGNRMGRSPNGKYHPCIFSVFDEMMWAPSEVLDLGVHPLDLADISRSNRGRYSFLLWWSKYWVVDSFCPQPPQAAVSMSPLLCLILEVLKQSEHHFYLGVIRFSEMPQVPYFFVLLYDTVIQCFLDSYIYSISRNTNYVKRLRSSS